MFLEADPPESGKVEKSGEAYPWIAVVIWWVMDHFFGQVAILML